MHTTEAAIKMKKAAVLTLLMFCYSFCFCQNGELIENKVLKFTLEQESDTIEFVVVDTTLNKKKPVFIWCQGSLPVPLFCEMEDYGYYFFGGGIVNFNYHEIVKDYHLVIVSMPETPIIAGKENLNSRYEYIPNPSEPNKFSDAYIEADYLDNYVNRALSVIAFLNQQKWVKSEKLVVAGHSQGSKVATKIAINNHNVTHLGLFGANPFGRIDQYVREARLDAQLGKISWEKADSLMINSYRFYEKATDENSIRANPSLKAWKSFSESFYDDWLSLDIPLYLAYGTEDRTADLCDIVPLLFIEKGKSNLTLKRHLGLEHNFFEVSQNGRVNHEKGHWNEVMNEFIQWIK